PAPINNLNSDLRIQVDDYRITRMILDAPTEIKAGKHGFVAKPSIAQSWEQVDPHKWRFKMRKDVEFSNGEPLDADAVEFSFEETMKQNGEAKFLLSGLTIKATAQDEFEVRTEEEDLVTVPKLISMVRLKP